MTRRGGVRVRLRRGVLATPTLAWLLGGVAAAAEPPACTATAAFDVSHAFIGQQVGYRVRIERRDDVVAVEWLEPPSFPGFRAQWLPDVAEPAEAGARTRRYEERRALFPERAGRLAVARAQLRCRIGEQDTLVDVPAVALRVEPLPTDDRPGDFAGLTGPLAIERIVTPQRTSLGSSIRVAVMLRGAGNLWLADDPLEAIATADVFPRRPRTSFDTGSRLTVKRHFAYDVVPLRPGKLEIPAIRVTYFDVASGRFDAARVEAVMVAVEPAANTTAPDSAVPSADGSAAAEPSAALPTAAERTRANRPGIAGALIAATVVAGAYALHRRRGARRRIAAIDSTVGSIAGDADAAAAIARALRLAIAPHVAGAAARTAEELAADPALPERVAAAVRLLGEAERARFDPAAAIPDPEAVRDAIARL